MAVIQPTSTNKPTKGVVAVNQPTSRNPAIERFGHAKTRMNEIFTEDLAYLQALDEFEKGMLDTDISYAIRFNYIFIVNNGMHYNKCLKSKTCFSITRLCWVS